MYRTTPSAGEGTPPPALLLSLLTKPCSGAGTYKTISSAASASNYRGATVPEGMPLSTWLLPDICEDTYSGPVLVEDDTVFVSKPDPEVSDRTSSPSGSMLRMVSSSLTMSAM